MRSSRHFREKVLLLVFGVIAHMITAKFPAPQTSVNSAAAPPSAIEKERGWRREIPTAPSAYQPRCTERSR